MQKLVFLMANCFLEKDYARFKIRKLSETFVLEIWNFTPLINVATAEAYEDFIGDFFEVFRIQSLGHGLKKIKEEISTRTIFINMLPRTVFLMPLFLAIKIKGFVTIELALGEIPVACKKMSFLERGLLFIRRNKMFLVASLLDKLVVNLFLLLFGVYRPMYVIIGGKQARDRVLKIYSGKSMCINSASFDYQSYCDDCISEKKYYESGLSKFENDCQYIVFLDEYVPFHPDFLRLVGGFIVDPGVYYAKMRNFFGYLEKKMGLRVVVAAHPRSKEEINHKYWQGFLVCRNLTLELVNRCCLVVMHASTSISYAVLSKKPIIFVTMKEFYGKDLDNNIRSFAETLGSQLVELNLNNMPALDIAKVDIYRYEKYVDNYLYILNSKPLGFVESIKKISNSL